MISLKFDWPNLVPINKTATSSPVSLQLASIVVVEREGGGSVSSVNGQTGDVVLAANDVGADSAGSAQAISDALQPQITTNTDAVAMLVALLSALQASKADLTYVNEQIANLVSSDAQTLATIQAITDALADNEDLLEALDQTVANRVRFDVATQGLTALQKYNARTNIDAEETGTAAQLISQITAASIGAVTAAQLATVATTGSYNDLSNKPVIPVVPTLSAVATSGSYNDLSGKPTIPAAQVQSDWNASTGLAAILNKPNITGTLLTGLTTATAAAISATDSIIGALSKLQASVDAKADAANTLLLLNAKQNSLPTNGTAGQFLAHDLTFKTPSGGIGVVWVSAVDACSNVNAGIDVSNLYFAKINGFLAVKGYYFGIVNSGSNINANSPLMTLKELYGVYCTTSSGNLRGLRNAVSGGTSFENYLLRSSSSVEVRSSAMTYKFGDPVYWSDACLGLLINP